MIEQRPRRFRKIGVARRGRMNFPIDLRSNARASSQPKAAAITTLRASGPGTFGHFPLRRKTVNYSLTHGATVRPGHGEERESMADESKLRNREDRLAVGVLAGVGLGAGLGLLIGAAVGAVIEATTPAVIWGVVVGILLGVAIGVSLARKTSRS